MTAVLTPPIVGDNVSERRRDDHRDSRVFLAHVHHDVCASYPKRHVKVCDECCEVPRLLSQQLHSVQPVVGSHHLKSSAFEVEGGDHEDKRLILNNQDTHPHLPATACRKLFATSQLGG